MIIMVLPFDKHQHLRDRYQLLVQQPVPVKSLLENDQNNIDGSNPMDGQEYATFMKSLMERNTWDSAEKLAQPKNKSVVARPSKSSPSSHGKVLLKDRRLAQSAPTASSVHEIEKRKNHKHKKSVKAIEEYMLVCKQEERDLKRIEGDIINKQRNLKQSMRSYENDIYNNQREQEAKVTNSLREEEKIKQEYFLSDEKITKDRIARNATVIQKEKEFGNKSSNTVNDLEFKFENIADAIEQKRVEVNNLAKDFESKLRQKEEEELRLKKEFANISMELNMEAQKRRIQCETEKGNVKRITAKDKQDDTHRGNELDDNIRKHNAKMSHAERTKRRYSQELNNTNAVVSMQTREEGRKLQDTKVRLQANSKNMNEARIKAQLLQLDNQGKQKEEKIQAVNVRRKEIQDMITKQRKQKNNRTTDEFRRRHFVTNHELKKQNLKDNIQHFKKAVDHQEEAEHALYHQVRHLESERRKQEKNVNDLKQQLLDTQKQNKLLLKETSLRCKETEQELERRLLKEEAQLGRALVEREEKIQALVKYRGSLKEEKHMLDDQKKVHDRLIRIEKRSELLREQNQQHCLESAY